MIAETVTTVALAGLVYLFLRRLPLLQGKERLREVPRRTISLKTEPDHPRAELDALFAEAERDLKAGHYPDAEKKLLVLERRQPHYPKLYNRLGIVYLEQGSFQRAVEAFERAVREDPAKSSRHANLGMAYLQVKKYSLAQKSFERAIEIEPKNDKYQELLEEAKRR